MIYVVDYPGGYYVSQTLENAWKQLDCLGGYMIRSKTLDLRPQYKVVYENHRNSDTIFFIVKTRRRNKRKVKYL